LKLELEHILPYLNHKVQVQYQGILNGKEISDYKKQWAKEHPNPQTFEEHATFQPPELLIGNKVGFIKEIGIYNKYCKFCIGIKQGGLKTFYGTSGFKMALQPLSDYTDMFGLPMVELGCDLGDQAIIEEFANKKISLASLPYSAYEVLVRNKVDIFELIPQNLAIDLNTLKP